jgi:hypothetical protein
MRISQRLAAALAGALVAGALAVALLAGAPARRQVAAPRVAHFQGASRGPLAEATHSAEAAENRRLARARARADDEAASRRARDAH